MRCTAGPGGWCAPRGWGRFQRQNSRESRRPGAERAVAWDPLGLVTHFIPVTTWARLERRPMGRRGSQFLRGTPALPAPDPARLDPSGGCRRPWAGSVSGRGSGLGPWGARPRASGSSNCAGSRAPGAAPGLSSSREPAPPYSQSPPRLTFLDRSLSACEAGVAVAGPGALAPGVNFPTRSAAELVFLSVFWLV